MAAANRGQTTGEPIWTTTRVPLDECETGDDTAADDTAEGTTADDAADDTLADDDTSHDSPILTRTRTP